MGVEPYDFPSGLLPVLHRVLAEGQLQEVPMGWETSDRRQHLPKNWKALREARFKLDGYQCTARDRNTDERCAGPAEECDHTGSRDDHRISMLRSLCKWHHSQKTARDAGRAAVQKRKKIASRFRREEQHPGLL